MDNINRNKAYTPNSIYKKLAVQWLNEALCFISSSELADSFVLRNRQLLVAASRRLWLDARTKITSFDNLFPCGEKIK